MEAVTYSLKPCGKNSESYYKEVKLFTDEVLLKAENSVKPLAEEYIKFLQAYNLEEIREMEEYILEILSFGVLWSVYAERALSVKFAPFITMAKMAEWRKTHQQYKPAIDLARGVMTTLFLRPSNGNKKHTEPPVPALAQIDHLCKWLEATGEFREQALRFVRWRAFWGTKTEKELYNIFSVIDKFTRYFDDAAKRVLGKYTENVEGFLRSRAGYYKWREDRIQCTRSRIEYHLNMVGAELMNRAFRKDFNNTNIKSLLLPGCMRISAEECKAKKMKQGLLCRGCTSRCRVNQLRELGKRENFDVYIIPHSSDLSLWSSAKGEARRGVVASACVTTLVEGGWELKRYDVPAQCVLLDYSGCKKHWHCEGVQTMLNVRELKRIVGYRGNKV